MIYETATLSNGLRVVLRHSASPVVYCGYQVAAGAQDEGDDEGLAHFCEHVTFKGTSRRKALDIIDCLESVGGELNAFTTKSDTVFYAAILREHLDRAVDLLTDVVFHSVYPQEEIDKEVEVICDEIEAYNDTPSELIYDEFENLLFQGTPLGHNILGTAERVRAFKTADALRFTRQHYRPDNAVFFLYGNAEMAEVIGLLARGLCQTKDEREKIQKGKVEREKIKDEREKIKEEREKTKAEGVKIKGQICERVQAAEQMGSSLLTTHSSLPAPVVVHRDTHQAHVMLGHRAYPFRHPRRTALLLLNNLLGGPSLNARLNLSLRERRGLVYTVESTLASYDQTGAWSVYFGCDPDDVDECIDLVKDELATLTARPLTQAQLDAARQQLKGQLGIAADNRESLALDMGKAMLHYGCPRTTEEVFAELDALTPALLLDVAREVLRPDQLTTLIYN